MQELTTDEIAQVSGGSNVEICQAGTSIAGAAIGGVIGAYGTLGFGTGAGIGVGGWIGSLVGTVGCSYFFA
ncbi:hypothetical protein [Dyella sp. EPa41]|uniref:hypothetical protein n=1 Tax=Dyella sp. EPa41 TaxID=1561194 RepID=UPI00191611D2|nr:hypothetical protein [Dyella sp. EPa41]